MRVLGVDPGTRHVGWAVLDQHGSRIEHVAHGVFDVEGLGTLAVRLVAIDEALAGVIATHAPEVGAVEGLFFARDAQSAVKLGHARGVILLRIARSGLEVCEYEPALVKRTIAGRGAADKRQVGLVVTSILRLPALPRADASDALAIALTHLYRAKFDAALSASRR